MKQKWTGERLETFVYNETAIEHLHRYAIALNYVKDKVVLDIACGEGYGSNLLADLARSVAGVDIDSATITQARNKYTKTNLKFSEGSVEQIPSPDHAFDVVVSFETLEHITEHEKMFHEIKRVLKPGGLLIVSTPEKKYYSDLPKNSNPFHRKELYETQFRELVGRFFCHYFCFYQTLAVSSIALVETEGRVKIFEGNYTAILPKNNIEPVYLIAVASDSEIDKPVSSLFLDKSMLRNALENRERMLKNSWSYRTGSFLLFPLKLIRSAFGR